MVTKTFTRYIRCVDKDVFMDASRPNIPNCIDHRSFVRTVGLSAPVCLYRDPKVSSNRPRVCQTHLC